MPLFLYFYVMSEKTVYVIELNDKMSPGLKKATAKAMGLDKAMGGVGKKGKKAGGGMNMLSGALTKLAGPLALAAAGMAAFKFASESIDVARKFEGLENAITFASGSAEKGAANMEYLRERSELLGLDLGSTAEGFKQFSGAMIGTALEGQATRDIFDSVQVASSVMGLGAEESKGAMLALSQMMGKGKVSAEELRGQLGERIPGAFNIAAKSMGLTTAELDKMMSEGKIMAEDFLPKFANELKTTFGPGLDKAVNSGQANLNRFNNTMLELKLTLGNALMPALNSIMSGFKNTIMFLKANWGIIKTNVLDPISEYVNLYVSEFKLLGESIAEAFGFAGDGAGMFETVMKGIGYYMKHVSRLAMTTIKILMTAVRAIVDTFAGIFNFLKAPIDNAKLVLNKFVNYFKGLFKGIGNVIKGVINFDIDEIKSGLKEVKTEGLAVAADTKNRVEGYIFKKPKESTIKTESKNFDDVLKQQAIGKGAGAGGAVDKDGKKASTKVDSIKSGRPTNVYININKLVESMNITATNIDDMNNKAKDLVAQALMTAVNNANLIAR